MGSEIIVHSEATAGFEPTIRLLQSLALPLGHVAIFSKYTVNCLIWQDRVSVGYSLQTTIKTQVAETNLTEESCFIRSPNKLH